MICFRAIAISYAFKKDSKGERHGSAAERLLAAQNPLSQVKKPSLSFPHQFVDYCLNMVLISL